MFDKIFQAFEAIEKGSGLLNMSNIVSELNVVISSVVTNFEKDKDLKNAVIDSIVQILQAHRDA